MFHYVCFTTIKTSVEGRTEEAKGMLALESQGHLGRGVGSQSWMSCRRWWGTRVALPLGVSEVRNVGQRGGLSGLRQIAGRLARL